MTLSSGQSEDYNPGDKTLKYRLSKINVLWPRLDYKRQLGAKSFKVARVGRSCSKCKYSHKTTTPLAYKW